MDFWSILKVDDLSKLSLLFILDIHKFKLLGYKINKNIIKVFDTWKKILILNPNDRICKNIYGLFLIVFLNENSIGKSLLEESSEGMDNYNNIKYFKHDVNTISKDGIPCVLAKYTEVFIFNYF